MGPNTHTTAPSMQEQRFLKIEAVINELTEKDVNAVVSRYDEAINTIASQQKKIDVLERKVSMSETNIKTLSFNAADGKTLKITEALKTLQTQTNDLENSFNLLKKEINEK